MNKLPSKKGFTLIELLIVVVVLGVLSSIVILQFRGVQQGARDAKRQSELKQYQTSLEVYANSHDSQYIASSGTVNVTTLCGSTQLNIPNCPDDPTSGQNYRYNGSTSSYVLWARMEKPSGGNVEYFILCSNGKVGKSTTEPSSSTCPSSL